jgi:hypothetical protein
MLQCGFVRANFSLAMAVYSLPVMIVRPPNGVAPVTLSRLK